MVCFHYYCSIIIFQAYDYDRLWILKVANYSFTYLNSTVTGQPFDDPRGRWRVGGGINVMLKVSFRTNKTKVTKSRVYYPRRVSKLR